MTRPGFNAELALPVVRALERGHILVEHESLLASGGARYVQLVEVVLQFLGRRQRTPLGHSYHLGDVPRTLKVWGLVALAACVDFLAHHGFGLGDRGGPGLGLVLIQFLLLALGQVVINHVKHGLEVGGHSLLVIQVEDHRLELKAKIF